MARYKTIALELICQLPDLYEELRSTKRLLPAMDAYALELREAHRYWKEQLARAHPGGDPSRTASEALELAIEELRDRLPCASTESDADDIPSLDGAMRRIRRHTPPG